MAIVLNAKGNGKLPSMMDLKSYRKMNFSHFERMKTVLNATCNGQLLSTRSCGSYSELFNTLRPRQDGRHFPDDIFKCILLNENVWILNKISLKFVPKGPINNIPSLVQIMAWRRPGDKPLSEPMVVRLLMHICVSRPQWVNWQLKIKSLIQSAQYKQTGEYLTGHTAFHYQVPAMVCPLLVYSWNWPYHKWHVQYWYQYASHQMADINCTLWMLVRNLAKASDQMIQNTPLSRHR